MGTSEKSKSGSVALPVNHAERVRAVDAKRAAVTARRDAIVADAIRAKATAEDAAKAELAAIEREADARRGEVHDAISTTFHAELEPLVRAFLETLARPEAEAIREGLARFDARCVAELGEPLDNRAIAWVFANVAGAHQLSPDGLAVAHRTHDAVREAMEQPVGFVVALQELAAHIEKHAATSPRRGTLSDEHDIERELFSTAVTRRESALREEKYRAAARERSIAHHAATYESPRRPGTGVGTTHGEPMGSNARELARAGTFRS